MRPLVVTVGICVPDTVDLRDRQALREDPVSDGETDPLSSVVLEQLSNARERTAAVTDVIDDQTDRSIEI